MKQTKAELKAKFVTGAIPTQADFANLIESMMNIPDGRGGDQTFVAGNGDKNGAPRIKGFRFINDHDSDTYLALSLWDNDLGDEVPVALLWLPADNPSSSPDTLTYHILNAGEITSLYVKLGGSYTQATDDVIVTAINQLNLRWYTIPNLYNNNPIAPRIIVDTTYTYICYPVKQNYTWYVGYVIEQDVDMGGSNQINKLTPVGNSQTKWNESDEKLVADFRNGGKWNRRNL